MKNVLFTVLAASLLGFCCTKDELAPEGKSNYTAITTTAVTSISANSARTGGSITSGGADSITRRGVCWSTAPNPGVNNANTTDGTGPGSFSSVIINLSSNTLYYVRAYAISAAGVFYGSQRSFRTL